MLVINSTINNPIEHQTFRTKHFENALAWVFIFLGTAGLILLLCGAHMRFLDFSGKSPQIGLILNLEGNVRYGLEEAPIWIDVFLKQNRNIHKGGKIFTGNSSKASLALTNAPEITIYENSLIILDAQSAGPGGKETPVLRVGSGNMSMNFKKAGDSIVIQNGGKRIALVATKNSQKINITVEQGHLSIDKKDNDIKINELSGDFEEKKIDVGLIAEDKINVRNVELKPLVVSNLLNRSQKNYEDVVLNFTWPAESKASSYSLSILKDDDIIYTAETKNPMLTYTLASGNLSNYDNLTYSVTAKNKSETTLWTGSATIIFELKAPIIKSFIHEKKTFFLTWEKTLLATNYVVEIASDKDFQNIILQKEIEDNVLAHKVEKFQTYYFRVKVRTADKESRWSKTKELKMRH